MALVGLMGSGKSAVGRHLARRLDRTFIDLDRRIERRSGRSVAEIFAAEGEDGFRARERAELAQVLAEPPAVVATGGGVVTSEPNRVAIRDAAVVVWLQVSPEAAARRVGTDDRRPLLGDDTVGALRALSDERAGWYREVSHWVVDTDVRTPEEVVDHIVDNWLSGREAQP